MNPQPLDRRMRDDNLLDEIETTSRLMIASAAATGPLTAREVDAILFELDAEDGAAQVEPAPPTVDRRDADNVGV